MKESIRFIKSELAVKTEKLGREVAFNVARTTLSSKIFGRESDFFANMAVDAMAMVKDVDPESGKARYPVKSVGIIKQHGGSAKDSSLARLGVRLLDHLHRVDRHVREEVRLAPEDLGRER